MPSYDSPDRRGDSRTLAGRMFNSAGRLINNRWTGRSWSELASSALSTTTGWLSWGAGQGLKIGINWATGGAVGWLGATAKGKELAELAGSVGEQAKEHIWPLIEDYIKGQVEEGAQATGQAAVDAAGGAGPTGVASARKLRDEDVEKTIKGIKEAVSELAIRAATVDKYLSGGSARYCDDVYYLSLNVHEIRALKQKVQTECQKLREFLSKVHQLADGVKTDQLRTGILQMAERVVTNEQIPHYNSYAFNVVGRATSCSKEHCYGKMG